MAWPFTACRPRWARPLHTHGSLLPPPPPPSQCLYGLLVFTTLNALSYTLGFILYLALLEYNVTMDWVTFSILIYNFGIVGVVAVFYQKVQRSRPRPRRTQPHTRTVQGIPRRVTQAYLIVISVVISYLLSFFPEARTAATAFPRRNLRPLTLHP